MAGDGECLNQNEGARPPRDRTGYSHMDLLAGKYKVGAGAAHEVRRRIALRRWPAREKSTLGVRGRVSLRVLTANVLGSHMRYHKAVAIHKVEADFIADTSIQSRNENVVICHSEQWYDVRALTEKELEEFVADLLRAQLDELRSGLLVPH